MTTPRPQPENRAPRITAVGLSRLSGALITGWLAYEAVSSVTDHRPHQILLLSLVACPAIALVFSLPRLSYGSYFGIGFATFTLLATFTGADAAVELTNSRDEVRGYEPFVLYFIRTSFLSLAGLALGASLVVALKSLIGVRAE